MAVREGIINLISLVDIVFGADNIATLEFAFSMAFQARNAARLSSKTAMVGEFIESRHEFLHFALLDIGDAKLRLVDHLLFLVNLLLQFQFLGLDVFARYIGLVLRL